MNSTMDLIYYHNACPDGWCAAFLAKRKYPMAELRPLDHGLTPEAIGALMEEVVDRDVLMVDYSLRTREDNDLLAACAKSFRILDHHKTAQSTLDGAPYAIFDMKRSGAGLTWDYLYGRDSGIWNPADPLKIYRPWYVNYIEDRDLWNWSLPDSRTICAYLGTLPLTMEAWSELIDINLVQATRLGEGALKHIEHFVRETVKNVRKGRLAGYDINILNATYLNCSEIGNELAKTADFSVTWFERKDDTIQFSLRSIGDLDVSRIARRFEGGGHKNAAGFQLPLGKGRALVDAILNRSGNNFVREADEINHGRCV